jgi:hypothetical protein
MTQAIANRSSKAQIGLALITLGTVMILANVSVVASRRGSGHPPVSA